MAAKRDKADGKRMGRPRKVVDEDRLRQLAANGCTMREIAAALDVSETTIYDNFSGALEKGRREGEISLRSLQWASARDGNVTMQIWLGKQLLGQKDKSDLTSNDQTLTVNVVYQDKPRADANDPA